ncbi:hypothetical protein [Halobacillus amylolyticus]|uniref:Uncharacterized protein n=1 Tax=Halobacillus amylolyticus TaxID=2932259 RepID=A0ABY4HGL0_9BACI|nr:hypothetical protein [Halobacillus amylolyticus]UOR13512.1 hypothetical protein MUO15_08675 [Halobacillus amylolyticus]
MGPYSRKKESDLNEGEHYNFQYRGNHAADITLIPLEDMSKLYTFGIKMTDKTIPEEFQGLIMCNNREKCEKLQLNIPPDFPTKLAALREAITMATRISIIYSKE